VDTRRIVYLSKVKRNPYVVLLCQAVNRAGAGCEAGAGCHAEIDDQFSVGWVFRQRRQIDVLHVHWLELFFVYPGWAHSVRRWLSMMLGLALARVFGVRLVYTVHNIWQHESKRPGLVALANRWMLWLAHAVHVHDAETAEALKRRWGRRRHVFVIAHGNYVGAYPDIITRQEAREQLGLPPQAFVYLSLGRVRPYKGLEDLLQAFMQVASPDTLLVVAGEPQEAEFGQELRALVQDDARFRLDLQFVPDDALQRYFRACDICVLPYRHVTTSGAAVLAFSFGTPIVAPRIGCFKLVADGGRGILYAPEDDASLEQALREARQADLGAMREAVRRYAAALDWDVLAREHLAMYRAIER
jgi:glycosyltransferase involved in cell wall biosynthesis